MNPIAGDVALLTARRYEASAAPPGDAFLGNVLRDDRLLRDALQKHGLSSVRVDWARPDVDWSGFRCAVFRTTWDYFERFGEFTAWLDRIEGATALVNPLSTVRWNMDKHYLADLDAKGIPIVASRFVERGTSAALADLLAESGWSDAILKPCVSAAANHTYRVNRSNAGELDPVVRRLLASGALILQPFQEEVVRTGEHALMVIGGRYTHAVRKVPKVGDFRVQEYLGGSVHDYAPAAEEIELAERAVAASRPTPSYGRVDMVRDNEGRLAVMELELIEPELWLRHHPPAADALAEAIAERVGAPVRRRDPHDRRGQ